ncbi:hypothetical protein PPTG_16407 [Phytophthora nicotianae INRA-310]|uniref:Uncharacterized protein n=1 Tax=Phytophthora nicotianae (strain INRA-310) TaxID=761204 RepID=W2PP96_PHYN3|nr:hypothetical protein PPTG_16407 [Phytophthora nicotianae INRA-310]ETN02451.1 hypothetical protein PPTG_16407 [Phytophthora nicotianae INRA-310]
MSVLNEPESVSNDGKHDITLDSVLSLSSDDVDESGGRSGGQLENEGEIKTKVHDETAGETFRATTAPVNTSTAAGSVRRRTRAVAMKRNKYWSTSYGQYESEGEKAVNEQRQSHGGCLSRSTMSSFKPPVSWKTLEMEKACNTRTRQDEGSENERRKVCVAVEDRQKIVNEAQLARSRRTQDETTEESR